MITRYISNCSSFRAKATVYATLSTMRGFGDYLVRQGLWRINPLRWMKGPKVSPYSRLPKRIDHAHMEAMWREAANRQGILQLPRVPRFGVFAVCLRSSSDGFPGFVDYQGWS
jgi:site-specific recombinase XerD